MSDRLCKSVSINLILMKCRLTDGCTFKCNSVCLPLCGGMKTLNLIGNCWYSSCYKIFKYPVPCQQIIHLAKWKICHANVHLMLHMFEVSNHNLKNYRSISKQNTVRQPTKLMMTPIYHQKNFFCSGIMTF
jgi:hypothetical protein